MPLSAPIRTMMHNVIKILNSFPTANARITDTKLSLDTSFMPNPTKGHIERGFDTVFLTLSIQLELSQSLRRKAGLQTLEVRTRISKTFT
eukprot:6076385-Amphidinium_carterae.1